ncbi:hypothetical protein GW17_00058948 [Ensete ventricosum]|nr:hypothetical protein GW17_00058948 [Ensete ventricosum]
MVWLGRVEAAARWLTFGVRSSLKITMDAATQAVGSRVRAVLVLITDAVVAARILKATLVVPILDQKSFWKDARSFSNSLPF